ncbi:MAG: TolC family protein [Helicobacter sp.]|nr:TolC family protein [Helicobacter sp.]
MKFRIFLLSLLSFASFGFGLILPLSAIEQEQSQKEQKPKLQNTLKAQILREINQYQKDAKNIFSLKDLLNASKQSLSQTTKDLAIDEANKYVQTTILAFAPQVNVGYSFGQNNTYNKNKTLSNDNQNVSVQANLNVFNGFKDWYAYKEAEAREESAQFNKSFSQNQADLQIINEYFSYFSNLSRYFAMQKKQNQINQALSALQALYLQGLRPLENIEVLKAQSALVEYEIAGLSLKIEQNKLNLELATNLKIDGLKYQSLKSPDLNKSETRGDILALDANLRAIEYQNSQLNYFPTININGTLNYSLPTKKGEETLLSSNFGLNVSFGITNAIGTTLLKQIKTIQTLSAQKALALQKFEQQNNQKLYAKSLQIAKLRIDSALKNYQSQDLAFQNIKQKFNANLVNFSDFLDALSKDFDALAQYNESINAYEQEKARFIFNNGLDLINYL